MYIFDFGGEPRRILSSVSENFVVAIIRGKYVLLEHFWQAVGG
jgi:hypothetical protein